MQFLIGKCNLMWLLFSELIFSKPLLTSSFLLCRYGFMFTNWAVIFFYFYSKNAFEILSRPRKPFGGLTPPKSQAGWHLESLDCLSCGFKLTTFQSYDRHTHKYALISIKHISYLFCGYLKLLIIKRNKAKKQPTELFER